MTDHLTSSCDADVIVLGTGGTKGGGPRTTVDGQVITSDGQPIEGLYAAGNAMAGVTGMVKRRCLSLVPTGEVVGQMALRELHIASAAR